MDETRQRFKVAEVHAKALTQQEVINPFDLFSKEEEQKFNWRQFMIRDLTALLHNCNSIYMLRGWQNSRGARLEHAAAVESDMRIFYEE